MMRDMQEWWPMGMGFGWIFMIVFVGFIIWRVTSGVRHSSQRTQTPADHGEESALEILQKRYARGELNQEEFERMRQEVT